MLSKDYTHTSSKAFSHSTVKVNYKKLHQTTRVFITKECFIITKLKSNMECSEILERQLVTLPWHHSQKNEHFNDRIAMVIILQRIMLQCPP